MKKTIEHSHTVELTATTPRNEEEYLVQVTLGLHDYDDQANGRELTIRVNHGAGGTQMLTVPDADLDGLVELLQQLRDRRDAWRARPQPTRDTRKTPPRRDAVAV